MQRGHAQVRSGSISEISAAYRRYKREDKGTEENDHRKYSGEIRNPLLDLPHAPS